jgi:hypothetical protein
MQFPSVISPVFVLFLLPCLGLAAEGQHPSIIFDNLGKQGTLTGYNLQAWIPDLKELSTLEGKKCWMTLPVNDEGRYLYVKILDPAITDGSMNVKITVTALDTPGVLEIAYDSYLFPWKTPSITKTGTGKWKQFVFNLPDATFMKRCNGADFRLVGDRQIAVAKIEVQLLNRVLQGDHFKHNWSLNTIPRFGPDTCGFSHGGVFWGPGGMSKEIFEKEIQIMKENGFGWLRYWPEWVNNEPEKGKFDWSLPDYMVATAKKYGIQMVGMVGFCTMWAADAPASVKDFSRTKYPPKNLSDLSDYVFKMVSRYKKDIHVWEGWNEQNAVGAFWKTPPSGRDPIEHYVAWQRTFYQAAKKADPTCTVLTGGFADAADFGKQLINYYDKGLKGTFDAMNIHIYGADPRDTWTPGQIETVIRVMRHCGDGEKKIWITETGWPVENHPLKKTLDQQAEWTPWLWAVMLSYPQIERVCFFQLRDISPSESFGWHYFDFSPRPVVRKWKEFLKTRKP